MRIAIIGSGALGLYYGALLQRAGNEVRFLLRRDYEAIRAAGLRVFSINGDFHLQQVAAFREPEEIGQVDLVIVGLKSFANHRFAELITPLLGSETAILTLQNGIGNEEELARLFGAERVLGGVAFLCSNRGEPGTVHHLGAGRVILGEFSRSGLDRAEQLAGIFRQAGVDCQVVADLPKARWEKLVWNIPFNGLCALLQRPVDALLGCPATRRQVREMMLEVIRAGNAQGLSEPIDEGLADRMIAFSEPMGAYRPSMQLDRAGGRPLELAAIFAIPLGAANRRGVAMPCTEFLHALLEITEPKELGCR